MPKYIICRYKVYYSKMHTKKYTFFSEIGGYLLYRKEA